MESKRGSSAFQPNALPLGQTGSLPARHEPDELTRRGFNSFQPRLGTRASQPCANRSVLSVYRGTCRNFKDSQTINQTTSSLTLHTTTH